MRAEDLPILIECDPAAPIDLAPCPNTRGVAVFESGEGRPVLILGAARLRDAIARRLAPPSTPGSPDPAAARKADLRPVVSRVRGAEVGSSLEGDLLFLRLAHEAMPETFRAVMDRRRTWFLHVCAEDAFPKFTVIPTSAMPASVPDRGTLIGPVADKHGAQRLQQTLEDLFDLCRFHHILVKAPHGTACAYKELGKCPAPCDGSETMDDYRARVGDAITFAHDPSTLMTDLEREMARAAGETDFERASALKSRLETARSISGHKTRHAAGDWRRGWAVLSGGPDPGSIRVFVIGPGGWLESRSPDFAGIHAASMALTADVPVSELAAALIGVVGDSLHRAARRRERIIALGAPDASERVEAAWRALSGAPASADDDSDEHETEITAEPQS